MKHLREKEKEAGKDVTLKDGREEEDIPEREDRRRMDSDYGRMRFVLFLSMSRPNLKLLYYCMSMDVNTGIFVRGQTAI